MANGNCNLAASNIHSRACNGHCVANADGATNPYTCRSSQQYAEQGSIEHRHVHGHATGYGHAAAHGHAAANVHAAANAHAYGYVYAGTAIRIGAAAPGLSGDRRYPLVRRTVEDHGAG
jgi:hypothetical protein